MAARGSGSKAAGYAHAHVQALHPYVPGFQPVEAGWIKLNTNELPYPPPPEVGEAIRKEFDRLARYPNPRSEELRRKLSDLHGLDADQVIMGNGSDDLLNLIVRAFGGKGRRTVQTAPSYSLYPVLNAIAGAEITTVGFSEEFSLPVEALLRAKADLLFLTCPNAPTGIRFKQADIEAVAAQMEGLLVIDEAYVDFAEKDCRPLLDSFEHVVLTRTFSKAFGLAGLRVGYALAHGEVIQVLDRVRESYNVNRLSQAGALAALSCGALYDDYIARVKRTRERVRGKLQEFRWKVYPSEANFLFARPVSALGEYGPDVATALFHHLKERKILVRAFPGHPLTRDYLRISIGTESEMEIFLEEIMEWTQSA